VGEEGLDVGPCLGVAADFSVGVAIFVQGPAVAVAQGVRDGVPGVGGADDALGSGSQRRDMVGPGGLLGRVRAGSVGRGGVCVGDVVNLVKCACPCRTISATGWAVGGRQAGRRLVAWW
jgi:hypothetical protein